MVLRPAVAIAGFSGRDRAIRRGGSTTSRFGLKKERASQVRVRTALYLFRLHSAARSRLQAPIARIEQTARVVRLSSNRSVLWVVFSAQIRFPLLRASHSK